MHYLRLLFWLKWTLLRRGYQRSTSALVGTIVALLVFLPMSAGLALFCYFLFQHLGGAAADHLLRAILLGIYLLWVLGPLMGYAFNETYDLTKLFLYPLTTRQIFIAGIAGAILDFTVILLLPVLTVAGAHFAQSPGLSLLVIGIMALFLFHAVSLSQCLGLAGASFLRSRRYRDLMIVLAPLFGIGVYLGIQLLSRNIVVHLNWWRIVESPGWAALSWLPPGLAARAIVTAVRGEYLPAAGFLLALTFCTIATVYLAGALLQRIITGDTVSDAPTLKPAADIPLKAPTKSPTPRYSLPPVVAAMAGKEVKYLVRDPFFKSSLMSLLYMLVMALVILFNQRHGFNYQGGFAENALWFASWMMLMSVMRIPFNCLGTEGAAASTLFLFPASRRHLLLGKNLALFAAYSAVNLLVAVILVGIVRQWKILPLFFCWLELATVMIVAGGNIISSFFPMPVVMRGWRLQQQSAGRGCGFSLLYLGISLGMFILLLPVLAAIIVPWYWIAPRWFALTLPLALAYTAVLYYISLNIGESLLLSREPEIIGKLVKQE